MAKITFDHPRWLAWGEKYISAPRTAHNIDPATQHMLQTVISFLEADDNDMGTLINLMREESFIFRVAESRAKSLDLTAHPLCIALIAVISDNPGSAVMHVHGAKYLQLKSDKANLSLIDLIAGNFPMGLISQEHMNQLWENQKLSLEERKQMGGVDNFLDYVRA